MQTVFSHIVQKRFSQENENVATDALAFILHSSESARTGMLKLLRAVAPSMPSLRFRSQQTEGSIRTDMWGIDDNTIPRVFVENKFWAGLTDNQPISYLNKLAEYTQPTILLVVVPEAREETVWRELIHRLERAVNSSPINQNVPAGIVHSVTMEKGPILALTSWCKLLSVLELEASDDQSVRSDLLQLGALCEAADNQAFTPISSSDVTNQRIPAFILKLSSIVQASVDRAVTDGVLNIKGLLPQARRERIGRYVSLPGAQGVGLWFGIHFDLWKKHGGTPLWLLFSQSKWSRAHEVCSLIEPWASKEGIFTTRENDSFVVAVDIATGEEKDQVVEVIVDRLKKIAGALSPLGPPKEGIV
jgi:hypothetical protein